MPPPTGGKRKIFCERNFETMRFIAPERLYLLAVLLLPAAAFVCAGWRRRREMRRLFADRRTAEKATRLSRGGRAARIALFFVSLVAALIAAARPYWKTRRIAVSGNGRDVAVVFDVSKSMWAKDLPPSRLEHAKFTLRQLAKKLPGDRLSLIAFAGDAYLACPLTSDQAVFDEYVDELSAELVQRGGTDLEKGLREALKSLRGAAGTQAIVVLTDGDELTGNSSRVVSELRERKIPLVVIGLGDPKKPAELPDENGAPRRGEDGKTITGRLNEETLKKLAAETTGAYIRSTVADTGADAAAARIAEVAPAQYGETEKEIPEERFDLFLALSAAALFLALVVPERPWRRAAAALLLILPAWGADAAEPPETREVRTAAELYNLGLERHQAGDRAGAERYFEAALKCPDRDERAFSKALFNLGAMEHETARRQLGEARRMVRRQELDPALKKLEAAEKEFGAARELYGQALSGSGAPALDGAAADNLRLYEADLKQLKELKKAIEELKKQLEKARQSAQNAQQQNQKQQKQDQQQQQNGQQKQDQKQNGQRNQQQGGQQNQQQQDRQQNGQKQQSQQNQRQNAAQAAARQAASESEKLRKNAEKLGQKQLEERARRAADDLRRAEAAPDAQSAQPHLDRAMKELADQSGGGQKKSAERKPENESKPDERKAGEKPERREESKTAEKPEPGETGPEQLLRMLDDEEREIRRELRRRNARPAPGRDW